jgi:hypothetical protein
MGEEFISDLKRAGQSLEEVAEKLCGTARYIVEQSSETKVLLRFSNRDRRPDWPEDLTIKCNDRTLLLTIHSATTKESEQIVRDVESVFHDLGTPVSLKEV